MKEKINKLSSKINMKYLFVIVPLVLIVLLIIVSSFFAKKGENLDTKKEENKKIEKTYIYTTKDNRVDFTFNEGYKVYEKNDYDLFVKDDKRQLITGIFTYDLNQYEENTSKEILDNQVAYFLKTRNNMKVFKKETSKTYEDKTITRVEYSGNTTDSSECIYVFTVIDFVNAPNYVVYSSQVLFKSDYEKYIKELKDIIINAKLK